MSATTAPRGAYVCAKNNVRWDPNDPDKEGWLYKKSRWVGDWRERYFVLKGSKLFFCKNEREAPHGMINLVDCVSAKDADDKAKRSFALELVLHDERFFLCAESEVQKSSWLSAVHRSIEKHSSVMSSQG